MTEYVSLRINIHPHSYARIRYWLTTRDKLYKVKPLLLTLWTLSFRCFHCIIGSEHIIKYSANHFFVSLKIIFNN